MKVKAEFAVAWEDHTWDDCHFVELELPDDEWMDYHCSDLIAKKGAKLLEATLFEHKVSFVFVHLLHYEAVEEEETAEEKC